MRPLAAKLAPLALLCALLFLALACRNPADEHYNRGTDLAAQGDYDGAIAAYSTAISINPDDEDAYNNRGNAHYDKGDYDSAIADYTDGITIDPDDAYLIQQPRERLRRNERI